MSVNKKHTSAKVASLAGGILGGDNKSQIVKKLAASALAQAGGNKQTGAEMESLASKVLRSPKYSAETKKLAATLVAQANKER